jgi:iron-sulfur cluster assembly protein|tara:strand:- start:2207 stop:2533 length:327 start_codon:yes stop_codon:yes gene_type:complete
MAISLTNAAVDRIKNYSSQVSENGINLRIGVKKTGCNGYAYVINYSDKIEDDDEIFIDHDIKIIVDKESLALIDGTEVDFYKEGLNEAFRFRNPKITGECGCGESFSI